METRVQIAAHFKIDPARQVIGSIVWPTEVTVTIAVGDELLPKKVAFSEAFSAHHLAEIEQLLTAKIVEVGRTAKPVVSAADRCAPVQGKQGEVQNTESEDDGMSLF